MKPTTPATTPIMIFLFCELSPESESCCEAAFNAAVTSAADDPVMVPILYTVRVTGTDPEEDPALTKVVMMSTSTVDERVFEDTVELVVTVLELELLEITEDEDVENRDEEEDREEDDDDDDDDEEVAVDNALDVLATLVEDDLARDEVAIESGKVEELGVLIELIDVVAAPFA